MTTSYAELCQFINDAGMDLITDEDNSQETRLSYFLTLLGTSFKVYIDLQDSGRLVQIYAYPRNHRVPGVSSMAQELLHEMLNEFNKEIRYGRWSVDDDGDARVHFSFFVEDAPLTRRQLARIHFLLVDLMIHQAQMLQIQAKLDRRVSSRLYGVSGAAVQAVIDYPSEIDAIVKAIHATEAQTHLLHDVIGKVFVVPESGDDFSDDSSNSSSGGDASGGAATGTPSSSDSGQAAANGISGGQTTSRRTRRSSSLH